MTRRSTLPQADDPVTQQRAAGEWRVSARDGGAPSTLPHTIDLMLTAAKEESIPLLAASLLSRNSPPAHQLPTALLYPGIDFVISNTATGLARSLYDASRRSRSTGKERDQESGLDYFGARYYGSALGRFTSPDPAKIDLRHLTNPQKWNKYAYTINNPLRYFDPDGFEEMDVQFRAFIQQKTVSDPIGRQFAGDNRSFTSAQNVSSRTSITVRIETDPNIRPGNPIISVTQPGMAGTTHQVDANGNVIAQKTATAGLPTVAGGRDANGNATLRFSQDTKNPLEPQALTPGISANLNVTVGQSGNWADVTGNLSMSPSFEMNFGSTNVPLNSELPGAAFGVGLIAPNTSVNQFVPLPPPPPPSPACANESGHCQ